MLLGGGATFSLYEFLSALALIIDRRRGTHLWESGSMAWAGFGGLLWAEVKLFKCGARNKHAKTEGS